MNALDSSQSHRPVKLVALLTSCPGDTNLKAMRVWKMISTDTECQLQNNCQNILFEGFFMFSVCYASIGITARAGR